MATINKVSPWEGTLVWVDTPRQGTSASGRKWVSVDFVLAWQDKKEHEGHILLNAFGEELAGKVLATPVGTKVRVNFVPGARQSQDGGKWWGKLSVTDIETVSQEETELPQEAPSFKGNVQQDLPW